MTQKIDLKLIEKTAYITYFQDGLWDIFVGLLMFASFINELIGGRDDSSILWLGLVASILFILGKVLVTRPRMGSVEFSPRRKRKMISLAVIMAIIFLMGVTVSILNFMGVHLPPRLMWITDKAWFPLFIIIVFSLIASVSDFKRLYYIGLMFTLAVIPTRSLFPQSLKFLIVSILILAPGLYFFVRFLRKYPAPGKEEGNARQQS